LSRTGDNLKAEINMATVTGAIHHLIDVFRPHRAERGTLEELAALVGEPTSWKTAHSLFDRIRTKTLAAARANNPVLQAQYQFEEACAKILYNLSGEPAPFDRDIFFNIVPRAFSLARLVSVSDSEIVRSLVA
jgi:hypothetical protein